jgi:hypothetical protein
MHRDKFNEDINHAYSQTLDDGVNIHALGRSYAMYEDIRNVLEAPILNELEDSLYNFRQAIQSLPDLLPDNYESMVRPYASALRKDLDAARDWQSVTQRTALAKTRELSNTGPK